MEITLPIFVISWLFALESMKPTTISAYSILELIPQRPPIVCVSRLLEVTERGAKSSFSIPKDFLFQKNGKITSAGLLENIAQTAAARAGYFARSNNENVALGFIASFKNLEIKNYPNVGDEIETEIEFIQHVLNMTIFKGEIFLNEQLIVQCEIRILTESD